MPIPFSPAFLQNVLGYAADVSTIPATTPSGTGAFSYQSGFPQITSTPLTAGGIAPSREDFNAAFQLLSQHVFFQQSGSLYTWNSALDYLTGAHILGSDGQEYIAQKSSGPDVPDVGAKNPVSDDGTYWKIANQGSSAGVVPVGGILPFSGSFGGSGNRFPIPLGGSDPLTTWCLCDGVTTNGLSVPDLRGLFICGASEIYPAGSTGGAATHTHSLSGTVGETTLTLDQLASHVHSYSRAATNRLYSGGGANPMDTNVTANTGQTGGSQPHSHTLSGASGEASSLPPYYVLSYIMRCA